MNEYKATVFIVDAPSDRRSATAIAHAKSPEVGKVYTTSGLKSPGGLLDPNCTVLPIPYDDPRQILRAAQEIQPDLIEVGQEDAIYAGVTDLLRDHGFVTFGVSRQAGRYEWDKAYARRKMYEAGTDEYLPQFRVFKTGANGLEYIRRRFKEGYRGKLYIKAAYPALGKGVDGVSSVEEAEASLARITALPNRAGRVFLVEDHVGGPQSEEFSGFYLGRNFVNFAYCQDHKQVYDDDKGPMTGGMGSVSLISLITPEIECQINAGMLDPLYRSLDSQNLDYRGILYLGGKYDPDTNETWNIEFNTRNGGSESAVDLPAIQDDYFEITRYIAEGAESDYSSYSPLARIEHDGKFRVSIAGTSLGYPEDYTRVLGRKVEGLKQVIKREEVTVLGAGIEDDFTVSGGRIFWIVAEGDTLKAAIDLGYQNMDRLRIRGDKPGENLLHYRHDIGAKELRRQAA